jgi:hypothetical protein
MPMPGGKIFYPGKPRTKSSRAMAVLLKAASFGYNALPYCRYMPVCRIGDVPLIGSIMPQENSPTAFSSEEHIRQVALRISRMSEAIHHNLRQLTEEPNSNSSALYSLLTEEYALRARANILLIEGKRFARPGFPASQQEVLSALDDVEAAFGSVWSPEELTELIVGLMLFANSIASGNNPLIALLLNDLKQLVQARGAASALRA